MAEMADAPVDFRAGHAAWADLTSSRMFGAGSSPAIQMDLKRNRRVVSTGRSHDTQRNVARVCESRSQQRPPPAYLLTGELKCMSRSRKSIFGKRLKRGR